MTHIAAIPLLIVFIFTGISCRRDEQASLILERQQALTQFQPVSYRRTAGLGREEQHFTITRDGKLETPGQSAASTTGQVSEFQMMQLARLFENWTNLQDKYTASPGNADAPTTEIQFGEKKVVANDAAANLPDQFRRVRERLEILSQEFKAAR